MEFERKNSKSDSLAQSKQTDKKPSQTSQAIPAAQAIVKKIFVSPKVMSNSF